MTENRKAIPCDKEASPNARKLLQCLASLSGKRIITGQHTQSRAQEELANIEKVTGELPALCGFELLSYSGNMQLEGADEDCLHEIEENKGTLAQAWDWAYHKKGLITFTWHWYSPIGGHDKSFYSCNTDFDASKAVVEGTEEYLALIRDMDQMAELLKDYTIHDIPILWRPFHEGDGDWFWWGAKGADTIKKLWRIMYDRYTRVHKMHNLIWVFNCPNRDYYPGDDVVDVISRDMYPEKHHHTDCAEEYRDLVEKNSENKLAAIGEIGVIPSVDALSESHTPWSWYMTWSHDFCLTEEWNTYEELCRMYHSPYAVTLRDWVKLSSM